MYNIRESQMKAIQVEHEYISNDILNNCEKKKNKPKRNQHCTAPVCVLYAGASIT